MQPVGASFSMPDMKKHPLSRENLSCHATHFQNYFTGRKATHIKVKSNLFVK